MLYNSFIRKANLILLLLTVRTLINITLSRFKYNVIIMNILLRLILSAIVAFLPIAVSAEPDLDVSEISQDIPTPAGIIAINNKVSEIQENEDIEDEIEGEEGNDAENGEGIPEPLPKLDNSIPPKVQPPKSKAKSSRRGRILSTIKKRFTKLKKIVVKEEVQPVRQEDTRYPIEPQYPEPFFDDIKYRKDKFREDVPIWIFNDKSSPENRHIPVYDLDQKYKIYYSIFKYVKNIYYRNHLIRASEVADTLDFYDEYGNTPLIYSIRYNNVFATKLLLARKANPSICNKNQICPVHLASFNGSNDILDLLLVNGVDLAQYDSEGIDSLIYAIYGGNFDTVMKLLDFEPFTTLNKDDMKYLAGIAYEAENIKIYQYFLQQIKLADNTR